MGIERDNYDDINRLIDLSPNSTPNAGSPLLRAFEHRELTQTPDFERLRQNILSQNQPIKIETFRSKKFYTPIAVAASTLVAIGVVYLLRQYPTTNKSATVVIASSASLHNRELHYSQALGVRVKSATNFSESVVGNRLQIKAQTLSAEFNFHPNAVLSKVEIFLPDVVFEVIGTKFILHCNEGHSFLAVDEGVVKIIASGKSHLVPSGAFWANEAGKEKMGMYGVGGQTLFKDFSQSDFQPHSVIEKIIQSKQIPTLQSGKVSITLKSGSVLRGTLVSQDESSVKIRAAATGGQVLRFNREEIARIRHLR
ncbi:MAG: hypothetical protein LDLANPLL_01928 [Turneriella sp.]|nr:hypothetical protein [Turneriella sp.]